MGEWSMPRPTTQYPGPSLLPATPYPPPNLTSNSSELWPLPVSSEYRWSRLKRLREQDWGLSSSPWLATTSSRRGRGVRSPSWLTAPPVRPLSRTRQASADSCRPPIFCPRSGLSHVVLPRVLVSPLSAALSCIAATQRVISQQMASRTLTTEPQTLQGMVKEVLIQHISAWERLKAAWWMKT